MVTLLANKLPVCSDPDGGYYEKRHREFSNRAERPKDILSLLKKEKARGSNLFIKMKSNLNSFPWSDSLRKHQRVRDLEGQLSPLAKLLGNDRF
ncbi:hypothetical protein AVEN_110653-1 [Araneus ventricosus]|uniref:Uncharacterized protein n=1 Tax=Araneus ventricosus TaxID=182803 RepID=A0A4Y2AUE3_ARAVE|nr:hypothetical protein AVEN_110653-1 [Araneus ventricosus]